MTSVETKGNENPKKLKDETKQKQTNKKKTQQARKQKKKQQNSETNKQTKGGQGPPLFSGFLTYGFL